MIKRIELIVLICLLIFNFDYGLHFLDRRTRGRYRRNTRSDDDVEDSEEEDQVPSLLRSLSSDHDDHRDEPLDIDSGK